MADFTKGWTAEGDLLSGGHTVAPVAPSRQFSGIGAISITPPETEQPFWLRALGLDGLMPKANERGLYCAVAVTRGKSGGGGGAADKVKDCLGSVPVVGKVVEKVVGKGKGVPVQRMER